MALCIPYQMTARCFTKIHCDSTGKLANFSPLIILCRLFDQDLPTCFHKTLRPQTSEIYWQMATTPASHLVTSGNFFDGIRRKTRFLLLELKSTWMVLAIPWNCRWLCFMPIIFITSVLTQEEL